MIFSKILSSPVPRDLWHLLRPENIESVKLNFKRVYEMDEQTQNKEIMPTYNIFMIHQDRFRNSIGLFDRNQIPDWIDVTLWGHEHNCRITENFPFEVEKFTTEEQVSREIKIVMPGAPIPTSLTEAEAGQKFVSKFTVFQGENGYEANFDVIPLENTRPFIYHRENLNRNIMHNVKKEEEEILKKIRSAIEDQSKPIFLRLRFQTEESQAIIQKVGLDSLSIWNKLSKSEQNLIANPRNFLMYRKKTLTLKKVLKIFLSKFFYFLTIQNLLL